MMVMQLTTTRLDLTCCLLLQVATGVDSSRSTRIHGEILAHDNLKTGSPF